MADYPTSGQTPWGDALKAYLDGREEVQAATFASLDEDGVLVIGGVPR